MLKTRKACPQYSETHNSETQYCVTQNSEASKQRNLKRLILNRANLNTANKAFQEKQTMDIFQFKKY
uniref:Ovule protein n=1 Tax=Romanomermis culicivorax TaxID=13658 RepID=A0A915IVQ5_ROMCU